MATVSTDTGWISPTAVASGGGLGDNWTSADYALTSNNVRTSADIWLGISLSTELLNCAFGSGISAAVPSDATIDGVEVRVEGYASSSLGDTWRVVLASDTSATPLSGTTYLETTPPYGSSSSEAYVSVGGSTNLWGAGSIARSDLIASGFRVAVRGIGDGDAIFYIDHVQIKAYYTYTTPEEDSGNALFWSI